MPDIANLRSWWSNGVLILGDTDLNPIITINPSSGGVKFANAGGITVSTGILGGLTISGGATLYGGATISSGATIYGGTTVSSGVRVDGLKTRTVTTAATLAAADSGRVAQCSVDGTIITLPIGSTTAIIGETYIIQNTNTGTGQLIVKTATTNVIIGAGISTTEVISNTGATHVPYDYVTLTFTGSTSWRVAGMVGTWASTT